MTMYKQIANITTCIYTGIKQNYIMYHGNITWNAGCIASKWAIVRAIGALMRTYN